MHAFWAHEKIREKYEQFLESAHVEGKKKSIIVGLLELFLPFLDCSLSYYSRDMSHNLVLTRERTC